MGPQLGIFVMEKEGAVEGKDLDGVVVTVKDGPKVVGSAVAGAVGVTNEVLGDKDNGLSVEVGTKETTMVGTPTVKGPKVGNVD